ncbi:MAG TPA: hypothetical protein EYQ21_00990 [Flavobacteriales bacterium]|jgi:hypothetical protein|nr:hypothetical protein [Flavobacteriales bacterium]
MEHEECYEEVFEKVIELEKKYSELMIAGNMMVHALRIYKSNLNDEEFISMMETIGESKNQIEPHNREVLH